MAGRGRRPGDAVEVGDMPGTVIPQHTERIAPIEILGDVFQSIKRFDLVAADPTDRTPPEAAVRFDDAADAPFRLVE